MSQMGNLLLQCQSESKSVTTSHSPICFNISQLGNSFLTSIPSRAFCNPLLTPCWPPTSAQQATDPISDCTGNCFTPLKRVFIKLPKKATSHSGKLQDITLPLPPSAASSIQTITHRIQKFLYLIIRVSIFPSHYYYLCQPFFLPGIPVKLLYKK